MNSNDTTSEFKFLTHEVRIGSLVMGGQQPILIQSMTVSDTCDTDSVVAEIRRLVEVGCPLVRVTAPSIKDAENLREIKRRLKNDGVDVPLVADIHFTPNAALLAAEIVEKVRINPGNYADRKKFKVFEVSDEAYSEGFEKIRERFVPLIHRMKDHGTALRIGTNHGSLSDRVMNRYGDTPEGMVESALEFARICQDEDFDQLVFSMKSSIPSVMIAAYRLLVRRMMELGMDYPLHIGVTEAGNGLEGRIKSTIGIGSLLRDGIGDTIRVSLTEDAEHEIGACHSILGAVGAESFHKRALAGNSTVLPGPSPRRRKTSLPTSVSSTPSRRLSQPSRIGSWKVGGEHPIRVEATVHIDKAGRALEESIVEQAGRELGAELLSLSLEDVTEASTAQRIQDLRRRTGIVPLLLEWPDTNAPISREIIEAVDGVSLVAPVQEGRPADELRSPDRETSDFALDVEQLSQVLASLSQNGATEPKAVRWRLPFDANFASPNVAPLLQAHRGSAHPLILTCQHGPEWITRMQQLAADLGDDTALLSLDVPSNGALASLLAGTLLLRGIGDVIHLVDRPTELASTAWPPGGIEWNEDPVQGGYQTLQACRIRLTKTEFIACPSCGRTQFNLQSTTATIRARTEHLKGTKIAIMGCIVNGPGEMADADFGYVGSGVGKIDLYVGKDRVEKNIPEADAEDRLVELLREHGAWIEPR